MKPRHAGRQRADLVSCAVLVAGTLLLFLPVLAGEALYGGDFHLLFVPMRQVLGASLREGSLLWTPLLGHGQPLLANPFAQTLYPPNLLFALPVQTAQALSWLVVGHVVFGALGTFRLLRQLGLGRPPAITGGAVFALGGIVSSSTSMVLLVTTVVWAPWLLSAELAALRAHGADRIRKASVFALVLVLAFLAGDPTILASCAFGMVLFPLASPLGRLAHRFRRLLTPIGGALLALAAVAPLAFLMWSYVAGSVRALPHGPSATQWSFHPLEALAVVLPGPFGGLEEGIALGLHHGAQPLFRRPYVGLLACTLGLVGMSVRRARPAILWLAIQVFLALGEHLSISRLALGLPGLSSTRIPCKWLLGGALPLALLAAYGLERLRARVRSGESTRTLLRYSVPGLVLSAGVAVGAPLGLARMLAPAFSVPKPSPYVDRAATTAPPDELARGLTPLLVASGLSGGGLLAAAVMTAILLRRHERERLVPILLTAFVGADLLRAAGTFPPTAPLALYDLEPRAATLVREDLPGGATVFGSTKDLLSVSSTTLPPELAVARWRLELLDAYSPAIYGLVPAFAGDVERLNPIGYDQFASLLALVGDRERVALLSAAGVTHWVSYRPRDRPELLLIGEAPKDSMQRVRVYRNQAALPRVRLVREIRGYATIEEIVAALRGGPDDLLSRAAFVHEAYLPAGAHARDGQSLLLASPGARAADLRVLEHGATRFVAEVDGAGSLLIVSETLAPGWRARLDGRPTRLVPANIAFRGVFVPPGLHRVEMLYRPFGD